MKREELLSSIRLRLPIENVSLEDDLDGFDFNGVILSGVSFVDCSLIKVSFAGAVVSGCDFSGCDMREAHINGASFVGSNFSQANFRGKEVESACFTDCDLSSCLLYTSPSPRD